ncbi:hypothetical protein FDP41_001996 [Naegleria fowleri]|uniref:SMP-30/Gluconolactonase/LRE-like region domain-containing protein n=1 Tax=Naegleria fowleri TaxID=5763 RepID=A0A6A5BUL0_NAEFO|nr:uncharacterized protein FDP41_001996 [Naegleria fowleri]KAF0978926.1 hypothetical protein FDP41_001996 [Naegleria fowleri]CAG4718136.1 unnamed protein product [Naegleria fowleri]
MPTSTSAIILRHAFQNKHKLITSYLTKGTNPLQNQVMNPFDCALCISSNENEKLLLVADYTNNRVLILKLPSGELVNHIENVMHPHGLCVDREVFHSQNGSEIVEFRKTFLVSDCMEHVVKRFDIESGKLLQKIGKGVGSENGYFDRPTGMCIDYKTRRLYVTDYGNNRIQIFNLQNGEFISSFGQHLQVMDVISSTSSETTQSLNGPFGIAIEHFYHHIHFDEQAQQQFIHPHHTITTSIESPISTTLPSESPSILYTLIYVVDSKSHSVKMFDGEGNYIGDAISNVKTLSSSQLSLTQSFLKNPYHVLIDGNHLIVSDSGNHAVKIFSKPKLSFSHSTSSSATTPHYSIAKQCKFKDGIGTNRYIYEEIPSRRIVDSSFRLDNNNNHEDLASMTFSPTLPTIEFNYPIGLALDFSTGDLFVVDCVNHRVVVIR